MTSSPQEPVSFFFRYRRNDHPARTYDVRISFNRQRMPAHIEIRHAGVAEDDLPPFSTGALANAPARRALALLELVGNIVAHDRSRAQPGAIVCLVHRRATTRPAAASAASPGAAAPARRRTPVRRGTRLLSSLPRSPWLKAAATLASSAPLRARERYRYPRHPI